MARRSVDEAAAPSAVAAAHAGAAGQAAAFDLRRVLGISAGHFVHDSFPAFLAPILPLLIDKLGISLALAGALVTVLRWSSLIQPFIGALADRTDVRYFVVLAPATTAIGMSLLGVAPSYLAVVVLLVFVGFSHAAFHPAAAAMVTQASGSTWGRGLSLFMAGGELGRALGPLYIVAIVQLLGFEWSPIAAMLGVVASVGLYLQVGRAPRAITRAVTTSTMWQAVRRQARPLGLLAGMIFFRSLAATSFATFLPTYLMGGGHDLWFAGIAVTVYELGGVAGALAGGTVSDLVGRRAVLAAGQMLSVPFLWGALALDAPWSFAALALAGVLALSSGPVGLALVQEILPENRAAASGIMLFLGFEGTVIATLAVGVAADAVGLGPALYASILASLFSLVFIWKLPDRRVV